MKLRLFLYFLILSLATCLLIAIAGRNAERESAEKWMDKYFEEVAVKDSLVKILKLGRR